jgi:hypothetical protein
VRMTKAQVAEQQQLIAAETRQMQTERLNADALDRAEQQQQLQQQPPSLRQQQQDPRYYDPRAGTTTTMPSNPAPPTRRPSLTGTTTRPDLSRTPSTRVSNPAQPRPERRQAPLAYHNNFTPHAELPAARERRPSLSQQERPLNPFLQPAITDPWDLRSVQEAVPSVRGPQGGAYTYPQQATGRMERAFYPESEEEERRRRMRRG